MSRPSPTEKESRFYPRQYTTRLPLPSQIEREIMPRQPMRERMQLPPSQFNRRPPGQMREQSQAQILYRSPRPGLNRDFNTRDPSQTTRGRMTTSILPEVSVQVPALPKVQGSWDSLEDYVSLAEHQGVLSEFEFWMPRFSNFQVTGRFVSLARAMVLVELKDVIGWSRTYMSEADNVLRASRLGANVGNYTTQARPLTDEQYDEMKEETSEILHSFDMAIENGSRFTVEDFTQLDRSLDRYTNKWRKQLETLPNLYMTIIRDKLMLSFLKEPDLKDSVLDYLRV